MPEGDTPLCLICYKPMRRIEVEDVPEEALREITCGLTVNLKMAERHGWIECEDCRCYSHLPTIVRLLEDYRRMAERAKQASGKKQR